MDAKSIEVASVALTSLGHPWVAPKLLQRGLLLISPLVSSSDRRSRARVASRLVWQFRWLVWSVSRSQTCLAPNTCPDWITSERSIRCLSWSATRPAVAAPQSLEACWQTKSSFSVIGIDWRVARLEWARQNLFWPICRTSDLRRERLWPVHSVHLTVTTRLRTESGPAGARGR